MGISNEHPKKMFFINLENIYIERDDQCWGGYGGEEGRSIYTDKIERESTLDQR